MNIAENLRTAMAAITANKLRSVLTMLGVIIGVYAVTTMLSLGQMATSAITNQLNQIGGRTLLIQARFEAGRPFPSFTQDDLDSLAYLPLQDNSTTFASVRASVGEKSLNLTLTGVKADYNTVSGDAQLKRGRFFSEAEVRSSAPVLVLPGKTAIKLFGSADPIGQNLRLVGQTGNREDYTVIGVTEDVSGLFGSGDSAFVPLTNTWRGYGVIRGEYSILQFKVGAGTDTDSAQAKIKDTLVRRRGREDFDVVNVDQFVKQFGSITLALQALLAGIGSLSLLVGGIGIMNIMLVSVTERTREIGLRKALGAKRRTILQQFLIEAVTLTALGGLIGFLMTVGTVFLLAAVAPSVFPSVILSPFTGVLALVVSVLTGVVFGVWPASRAANLPPIEALRYE